MTYAKFLEKYGKRKVTFDNYYKGMFTFTSTVKGVTIEAIKYRPKGVVRGDTTYVVQQLNADIVRVKTGRTHICNLIRFMDGAK